MISCIALQELRDTGRSIMDMRKHDVSADEEAWVGFIMDTLSVESESAWPTWTDCYFERSRFVIRRKREPCNCDRKMDH